jgi:hypothetical protein
MSEKLRGEALLAYVSENPGLPEKDLVIGAGYTSEVVDAEGGSRVQIHTKPFYQELAVAKGLIEPSSVGRIKANGRPGKGLSYKLKSNPNSGNVVITGGYTEQIGLLPGEKVSVEVIAEAGEVVLKRIPSVCTPPDNMDQDQEIAAASLAAAVA